MDAAKTAYNSAVTKVQKIKNSVQQGYEKVKEYATSIYTATKNTISYAFDKIVTKAAPVLENEFNKFKDDPKTYISNRIEQVKKKVLISVVEQLNLLVIW